ncbi:Dynein heavy chain [Pestalotiopsis fici W106-1]|uniref:Dynein heavy chain, cytoplasmic n=1 Tax=Pestalotiopsis fici (strain W106-1 / CGMCC3.15140) TaxID=1229662 RepID=W3XC59_PESFW|nr:Dynein heavy chain [Pestalotiopsis fici W106-1]ETS83032.1 Dynein heavy chain [Pestalotiopsis fici W106-1]
MMETVGSPLGAQDPMANGVSSPPSPLASIDPSKLVEHLAAVVTIALGATREDLERDGNLLSPGNRTDTLQRCARFASDSQVALYIQKEIVPVSEEAEDPEDNAMSAHFYTITSEISPSPTIAAYLAFLKRPQAIDPSLPLTSQIQIQTLPGAASLSNVVAEQGPSASPFEILHTIVHNALAPYFDASTRSSQAATGARRADIDGKTGIPVTKKRLTELELSLLHLQQNVEIPELMLPFHSHVQAALDAATAQGIRPSLELIPTALLSDSGFMNSLQATVNSWIKSIQGITKMTRDPVMRTATQEINFWLSMESALESIEQQLRSEGVMLTLEILKHAKRFQATVSFSSDTGLKEAMDTVQKYNQLMRDFPLDDLLSATSLPKVNDAIIQIFGHMNRKMRFSNYPIKRTLDLVEAISAELKEVMHRLLPGTDLVNLDYDEFKALMKTADEIFHGWDMQIKEFTNIARETTRRRQEKFIPIKINPKHSDLQARLKYIATFRDNHEQLQRTIVIVLGPKATVNGAGAGAEPTTNGTVLSEELGDVDAVQEVRQAWESLKNVDLLDVSDEGTQRWARAENNYNERTTRVENSIIARLRDRLATAKNANEMFRVFSQFNALFVRPKIRGAIAEYQNQLIDNVKQAISALHERFKQQYGHSEAHAMAQLHDLPPVSGAIIWARQIERQLDGYMGKVEDILGSDWIHHTEGQKLQTESDLFRKKLDTQAIYKAWIDDVLRKNITISGRLFNINKIRSANNALDLSVNFDAQIITLFKETRNLGWQNFNVPHSVNNTAKDAKRVYPYAVSLMESVRTFAQTSRQISEMSEVSILLGGYQQEVYSLIEKGVPLKWGSFLDAWDVHMRQHLPNGTLEHALGRNNAGTKHVQFVRDFAAAASVLQSKTIALASIYATVQTASRELATCPYEAAEFEKRLQIIQAAVDQLNLEQYVNLGYWVERLNEGIKATLLVRLQEAIGHWIAAFEDESPNDESSRRKALTPAGDSIKSNMPVMKETVHEITMRNQVIYLDPPLEFARASWFLQLHEWLGVVCNLPKIKASRYQMTLSLSTAAPEEVRFTDLPGSCAEILSHVYLSIETKLANIAAYVDKWLQFQSLWDLQSDHVYDLLGEQLSKWLQLLQEIRKSRATFDTTEVSRSFGRTTIDYEQVQTKVNAKYDQWQHDILGKFGSRLGGRMREVHAEIEKARRDLESQGLDASSTAQAVQFITIVQSCKRNVKIWAPEVDVFRQGQQMLHRNRYQLPNDWLDIAQIENMWDALNDLLARKSKIVEDQTDALKAKILAEDKIVTDKIAEIDIQWNEEKPVSGTIPHEVASKTLGSFESRANKLQEDFAMVSKAKEALDLPPSPATSLSDILGEIEDFKSVWANLSTVWNSLNELGETPWASVQPRKLRSSINGLIETTKNLPSRMRQYAAYEHMQTVLKQHLKAVAILTDLKSDAIKERHWEKLWKDLKPGRRYSPSSTTLSDVWQLNLVASEVIIRDVITQAQGEMALEEFLKQVKDHWENYNLDLTNYQNKCRLLRKDCHDDMMAKSSEHLNSLQAMKHSPYYKTFQQDADIWETRMNEIGVLLDVFQKVQQKWVYLEGVFTGSADIKHLLPNETRKFENQSSQFHSILKAVARKPTILDVLRIENVEPRLRQVEEALNSVSSGLEAYLEKERASFPRFYFVGNDDLLEMIGNSNETLRITKHFKKMFAGINNLIMDDETTISGFTSKEGEAVRLKKSISLVKVPKINDWLALLENGMKYTLAELLAEAIDSFTPIFNADKIDPDALNTYIESYPSQMMVLATQAVWTTAVEASLANDGQNLQAIYEREVDLLRLLADTVLGDLPIIQRKKCEALITNFVHQRDIISKLMKFGAASPTHYLWLLQMRYVYTPEGDYLQRLQIKMANAALNYGFEYLGIPDRLVRTPLTDRCFLTMTQALCQRLGGSPYGPAGTGKTESVKALGVELGRFTLVFCCDDTFDDGAMGRIFLGLCQVGAWGCFDEFNRLEERILSAVSQQIQDIQLGLKHESKVKLKDDSAPITVDTNSGIFITMNPGYAGRSNLPDNLKKLFRSVAMSKPDKELIAEVMLYSQGFKQAKQLSKQVVPFFDQCKDKLEHESHYDFGLRALKSVLVSSGGLKRARITGSEGDIGAEEVVEPEIIVQSIRETVAPKLLQKDVAIMESVEASCFEGVQYVPGDLGKLEEAIRSLAKARNLVVGETWMTKIIQLYQIQNIHHGVMMVGNSGSGKSVAWRLLLDALKEAEGVQGVCHVIDSKVMSKEALYGVLDPTTREWTDGLFTSILRAIIDNLRGEDSKRHWIVFDGDVDPEWVENLNSVLDDNKLLTLPNGERLNLPSNVRVMFEVENLNHATPATVSRCGMVWFSEDVVNTNMMVAHYLESLRNNLFENLDEDVLVDLNSAQALSLQKQAADYLEECLTTDSFIHAALKDAQSYNHIMLFTQTRVLETLFSLLNKAIRNLVEYNAQHSDFPLDADQTEAYISKKLLLALVWAFTGDCPLVDRKAFGDSLSNLARFGQPPIDGTSSLIDFDVSLPRAEWIPWQNQVPAIEVHVDSIVQTDVVIPTTDTVRHEDVLYSWLADHKPLLLCGPPGSGKTMTLFSALRKLPNMEVAGLNFSSATTPELLIKTFDQYCEYKKTLNGVVLSPTQTGRWLVVFCDEINLPAPDQYGTQRAISFLRQLVEHNGFWRTKDKAWVTLDRIQFVGACNPPTDAGRTPLTPRFLRHAPLIMVDYPGEMSLNQIYGTFNSAVLKTHNDIRGYADDFTQAMVRFYLESQQRFTAKDQPHYVYSPRELTRWVRGVYEALREVESMNLNGLVRIWAHEALRLFHDRLVTEQERQWTIEAINRIALKYFPQIDEAKALGGPILFSNWLNRNYVPVGREELRTFVKERLKTFCEEEVDMPLVLFNEVLEHALRIDRVFQQPQGHLILIGVSGSGKTTLSRFVAWMNGLKVFQIKVHGRYSATDFDDDLRDVLRACGTKDQKMCFIMDESNVLDSGFLERMNTLLANAEVPGLFEGDEYTTLMTACREGAQREGQILDSNDELYKWFTGKIVKNLHVVFTMNPPEEGLSSKAATSPALFNRCVLNWMGDWSDEAFFQVGKELTSKIDLDRPDFVSADTIPVAYRGLELPASHRDTVINSMVYIHHSLHQFNRRLRTQQNKTTFLTPRHFLDFVAQYVNLYNEKRDELEDQQRHLNVGLTKLNQTVDDVNDLEKKLKIFEKELEEKIAESKIKLSKMVEAKASVSAKQTTASKLQETLSVRTERIEERKTQVDQQLADAGPAIEAARSAVSSIKKQHMTELAVFGSPPQYVKNTIYAVLVLLGQPEKEGDWNLSRAATRSRDFQDQVANYDARTMTKAVRAKIQKTYLNDDNFTVEAVYRSSKACGPLLQWLKAQVKYSEMLEVVQPLNSEVDELEEELVETTAEHEAIKEQLVSLEKREKGLTSEFQVLTSDISDKQKNLDQVKSKLDRSNKLIRDLSSERYRWDESSKSFAIQMGTLVGDVLLAAAFLAYGGLYDQVFRKSMMDDWLQQVAASGLQLKQANAITEYLSVADERLHWQTNGLPVDNLCTENAIILKRYNRYPLIVDPSGGITEFLLKDFKDRRLTVTSFLDANFAKQLESAIRFGNPILIQDAEHLDPVLNPVLNREYQRTGGRVLIQLGKQQIDFSPSFKLYLSTRDPSVSFPPDICSRTTFVNFTVTQSSLQTQSLDQVLKSERPDVDEKRSNSIKAQGEYKITLRRLEDNLLQALNESEGNLLENNDVISKLESLKKEAADIAEKMSDGENAMAELETTTRQYNVVAQSCSSIFSVLDQLHNIDRFYQFSLQYFLDIFTKVLRENDSLAKEPKENDEARRKIIVRDLFVSTFKQTASSLFQKHLIIFALLLLRAAPKQFYAMDKDVLDVVLSEHTQGRDLSTETDAKAEAITKAKEISVLASKLDSIPDTAWDKFLTEENAEDHIPQPWDADTGLYDQGLLSLLLVKLFRVDRFVPAAERLVTSVFGSGFFDVTEDLKRTTEQVKLGTPISLVSTRGFDASYKVDQLVQRLGVSCTNVAMGSKKSQDVADKAIADASSNGRWVLIKNVHLTPDWLQSLEKRLESRKQPHPDFRLFLSMEAQPKIPVNFLRASRILMNEQSAGIRANMKDTMTSFSSRAVKDPRERTRLYFLLSFLHAVIQERLRYAPLGWKQFWEFNDSDYECSAFIVDTWLEHIAQNRSNVDPKNIPWDMIRSLVRITYGGKIDDDGDYQVLDGLVNKTLHVNAFEHEHKLVEDSESGGLTVPSEGSLQAFQDWINKLPEREPPTYLGLPANAEKLLLAAQSKDVINQARDLSKKLDESEQLMDEGEDHNAEASA